MEKYVLTGGPGTGKTTLLSELEKAGETTLPEAAREIIAEEKRKEHGILPWTDLAGFQELVMQRQVQRENGITENSLDRSFQDRGLPDGISYAEEGGIPPPGNLLELIGQANYTRILFLERLPFYKQDEERQESPESALQIHQRLYQVYDRLGFDIVTVPICNSIEERVLFVLKEANSEKNREIEKKYRVEHLLVRDILNQYAVKYAGTDNEENKLYDFRGILKGAGCVFRIRENNGKHILTLKGPTKNRDMTNKREYNFSIPQPVSKALQTILPGSVSYSKRRENYRPLGDNKCTISLDYLPQLGEFVEIEAATENQVLLWERRLGIGEYAIKESYPALVRKNENPNSR